MGHQNGRSCDQGRTGADFGKFYLFFKGSGLPARLIEDIKLQIQGDLRKFQEARSLALRLTTRKDDSGHDHFYESEEYDEGQDFYDYYADDEQWEYWMDDSWQDDGWSWYDDYENYNAEQEDWSWEPEDGDHGSGEFAEAPWFDQNDSSSAPPASSSTAASEAAASFPVGKGKGKFSCSICGSRWRSASSCPVNGGKKGDGKGGHGSSSKGKGYGFGPSKGYGGYGKNPKGRKGYKGQRQRQVQRQVVS